MRDLTSLTITEARTLLQNKEVTSVALTEAVLGKIALREGEVHAYLEVFDDARKQAAEADEKIARGETGALLGIPLAIKDNILIAGRLVSAGSKILEGYKATYDATVIEKLKAAGAVLIGRANLDEFAMGSSTENSAYGVTKNPHDLDAVYFLRWSL
jgi:aspartyl-tRNA(Asn)/glutamyl-tRNA(Gln) amidotransferase subunit A